MFRRLLVVLGFALALTACGGAAKKGETCHANTDCEAGLKCDGLAGACDKNPCSCMEKTAIP